MSYGFARGNFAHQLLPDRVGRVIMTRVSQQGGCERWHGFPPEGRRKAGNSLFPEDAIMRRANGLVSRLLSALGGRRFGNKRSRQRIASTKSQWRTLRCEPLETRALLCECLCGTTQVNQGTLNLGGGSSLVLSSTGSWSYQTAPAASGTLSIPSGSGAPAVLTAPINILYPVPQIRSISPSNGSIAGGTTVAISGNGFTGVTSVDFGGVPGTIVSDTDTQIVVTSPVATA